MNQEGDAQSICLWPELDNGKVLTGPFLNCCDVVVDCFAALGTLMIPVKNDVSGNVLKLRKIYIVNQEKYQFLQDLITCERKTNPKGTAVDALLWLKRGLQFIYVIMDGLVKDAEQNNEEMDISNNYLTSYNSTLRPYHNFAIQSIFKISISRMPNRRGLLLAMPTSKNVPAEISIPDLVGKLKPFLRGFHDNLNAVILFYHAEGLDSVATIR